jgi:hypothetical protein
MRKRRNAKRFFWSYPALSEAEYQKIVDSPGEFIDPLVYAIGVVPRRTEEKPFINTSLSFVDELEFQCCLNPPKLIYCPSPGLDLALNASLSPRSYNFTARRPVLRKPQLLVSNKENTDLC